MCHVLGVKSKNYYSYQKRKAQRSVDTTHKEMLEWVKDIAKFSDKTYDERRIQKALNELSFPVSRRQTAQLMKEERFGYVTRKKINRRQIANTTNLFTRTNWSKTLMFNNQIKRGCKILPTYGLQRARYIWR